MSGLCTILSVLLYKGECWTPLKKRVRKLDASFANSIRNTYSSGKSAFHQVISERDGESILTKLIKFHFEFSENARPVSA